MARANRIREMHSDFGRLWAAYAVSAAGSAVSAGALPLIAVALLHATTFQVSLLAALSAVAGAAISLPLGGRIEYRRKRPVMIAADVLRFAALGSVPLAAALGALTYPQLCVVGIVQAAAAIVFGAASTAHLKGLVAPKARLQASARFESTTWISQSAGPPLGGLLIGVLGPTITVAVDAVSFLLSAAGVRRIRRPEPEPPQKAAAGGRGRDLPTGWRHIFTHGDLRPLFVNSLLFGGAVMMSSPLLAVFMLRELHFTPWQYGLALGLPCLGGVLGSRLTGRLTRRFGARRVLLVFGVARTPFLALLPWAPAGALGLALLVAAETGTLVAAGVFNPSFAAYRMAATHDHLMARVVTAWSVGAKTVQPVFMVAGGVAAGCLGVRTTLLLAGVLCMASAALLPWRGLQTAAAPEKRATPELV